MFYENNLFPWLPNIQNNWRVIRRELESLGASDGFAPWYEKHIYNKNWNIFGLYGWGVKLDKHCDMVPETTKLIETIPGLLNAGFSRMGPKTHIKPHKGFPEGVLRLHIPLIVPEGCALRVEREVRQWKEGELFVFDDCMAHEAWNNSDEYRTVMLVDFPADDLVVIKPRKRRTETFVRRLFGKQTEFNYLPKAAE
jgi:aspartyl/asparaginyl beta-hydroxylase (cupin superfamily)